MENWLLNTAAGNRLNTSKLQINDLSKLTITKIRLDYDKLYFTYNNMRYFVTANYDCGDQWFSLHKKDFINGRYKIELIATSGYELSRISYLLDNKTNSKRNIIYSHIDKQYFTNKLREYKLIN